MDKDKYYEIIERIDECLYFYEHRNFDNTKFYIDLANGEYFSAKYDRNNIPHLLGINVDALRSTGLYSGYAYDILDGIVRNPYSLYNNIQKGFIKSSDIFSDHIDKKLANFKTICGINIFDIEFIVKYDKNKNLLSEAPLYNGYYIGYVNDSTLSVVGFEYSDRKNTYHPHTSLAFEEHSPEADAFLKRLFNNQTATTIEMMRKSVFQDDGTIYKQPYFYYHRDKITKLKTCKRYAETYNGVVNTISSNIYYVDKVINLNDEKKIYTDILLEIAKKITERRIIDIHSLQAKYGDTDKSIQEIVSAYNDSLVNKNKSNVEESYSYKDLIEKYESCKAELDKVNNLIEKANKSNELLRSQNQLLRKENGEYKTEREQIQKILSRKKAND